MTGRSGIGYDLSVISTHTSLAGRDNVLYVDNTVNPIFLLTRPSRDVTELPGRQYSSRKFLLTRPSRDVTYGITYCG